jgi:hypothetical protein
MRQWLEKQMQRKIWALIREMRKLPHFSALQPIIAVEQQRLYESGLEPEDALAVAYMNLILLLTP